MRSPRISAFHIHEWIFETLKLAEEDLSMIQIDRPKRQVYIKFHSEDRLLTIIHAVTGQHEYKHNNGEISKVTTEPAGLGMRTIRIANLPRK
jgi:hypothetical protein